LNGLNVRSVLKRTEWLTLTILIVFVGVIPSVFSDAIRGLIFGVGGYVAVFFLALVSSVSIIPVPYHVVLFRIASTVASQVVDPISFSLSMALVGGLGAALGEAVGWGIGAAFSKALEGTKLLPRSRVEMFRKIYRRRLGKILTAVLIALFAATPLPDKLLFLVLGASRFSLLIALLSAYIGKVVMLFAVLYAGIFLGETVNAIRINPLLENTLVTAILILALLTFMAIPWERIAEKIFGTS